MQFVENRGSVKGRWEIRKMCLTFSSVPPHFSFGFQMRCHISLLGLQLVFSDSCPNVQRIFLLLLLFVQSYPLSSLLSPCISSVKMADCTSRCVFPVVSWTPPPEVCSLSQINRSRAKLSCFLLDLCLPLFAFHLCEEHHLWSDGSRQKLGHCPCSFPFL